MLPIYVRTFIHTYNIHIDVHTDHNNTKWNTKYKHPQGIKNKVATVQKQPKMVERENNIGAAQNN